MLTGAQVRVRPVAAEDVAWLHSQVIDLDSRGAWYPLPRRSLPAFQRQFEENGFWTPDGGLFIVETLDGRIIGQVEWDRISGDIPDMEIGYRIFGTADRGKGFASQATLLLARWLLDGQQINRLRLTIHVDNVASRRVAEKMGFTLEAVARESWPHRGVWHDACIYTITRREFDERWGDSATGHSAQT